MYGTICLLYISSSWDYINTFKGIGIQADTSLLWAIGLQSISQSWVQALRACSAWTHSDRSSTAIGTSSFSDLDGCGRNRDSPGDCGSEPGYLGGALSPPASWSFWSSFDHHWYSGALARRNLKGWSLPGRPGRRRPHQIFDGAGDGNGLSRLR